MKSVSKALLASAALLASIPVPGHAATPRSLPVGPCLNLGNTLEVPRTQDIGAGMVGPADFARIRAAGFETVRIPVRWDERSQKTAPYTVDAAWMKRVQTTVDQALAAGLKVILNSHHFEPIHQDPLGVQPWHTGVWVQIAQRFKDYPTDRLWFELGKRTARQVHRCELARHARSRARRRAPDQSHAAGDLWRRDVERAGFARNADPAR